MRKGFEKSVANESVGCCEVVYVKGEGCGAEEVQRVASGDEAVGDGGVRAEVLDQ